MKKIIILLFALSLFGCEQSVETPTMPEQLSSTSETGTVLETIAVDAYTYLRLDVGGSEVWIASNPVWVSEGDVVRFYDPMLMKDFRSETLDRTFADILFVRDVELVEEAEVASQMTSAAQAANPHAGIEIAQSAPVQDVEVEALEGGMQISEIRSAKDSLTGQEVSLRAVVTKFSPKIMGKNWVTLEDGSGSAPDNQLLVTTSQTVAVGNTIVVKGVVKTNVDIGAGYEYDVLLEEAVIAD